MSEIELLRAECALATKFWSRLFSALSTVTYRDHGEEAVLSLWKKELGGHQKEYYVQGLQKLGIQDSEPPAVKAAKYHYFTNLIGGIQIQYIEESPKKVWLRYMTPSWMYPGNALLAMPLRVRRTMFSSWHPFNGKLMGCPRLAWVATRFASEGVPYDEGYFIEHDHDLSPGEEMQYATPLETPEFDPAKAPQLDPVEWPEARYIKANRNFSGDNVVTTIHCLYQMFGEAEAHHLVENALRGLAVQNAHELQVDLGVDTTSAKGMTDFFAGLLQACKQDFEIQEVSQSAYRILLRSFMPFETTGASEQLRHSFFEFQRVAAWTMNGRISVTRTPAAEFGPVDYETWNIVDAGRWIH